MKSFAAFILTHEDLAFSLKATAEKITGPQQNIFPYSNNTEALQILFEKIKVQIDKLKSEIVFIFVDLVGGSCWSLANMIYREYPEIYIVGGVNLPMILSLIINHEKLSAEQLIDKIVDDSKKGIKVLSGN